MSTSRIHRGPSSGAEHIHLPRTRSAAATPRSRVAILGTGKMGSAIAERLMGVVMAEKSSFPQ